MIILLISTRFVVKLALKFERTNIVRYLIVPLAAIALLIVTTGIIWRINAQPVQESMFDVCDDTEISGDAFIGHDHPSTGCGHYVSFGFDPPTNVSTSLQRVARGAGGAVDVVNSGVAGDNRLFIVGQQGRIYISNKDDANVSSNVFLNLTSQVTFGGEQGLLGMAFDPNYAQNGYFYVYYIANSNRGTLNGVNVGSGDIIVSRFSRDANNPNLANPASELPIFGADHLQGNHNGGGLRFGPDGYLYIATGDGGGSGDNNNENCTYGNGQCMSYYLGKILRIDVRNSSTSQRYRVPADNPFVGQANVKTEIWHTGLRNPWRFNFDKQTGDMWIGDVGQGIWEEIDLAPAGSKGLNFGWRCYEGNATYSASNNPNCSNRSQFTFPVHEYNHSNGCSVTGGHIYRGTEHPEFVGTYVYGDYCTSDIWYLNKMSNGTWQRTQTVETGFGSNSIATFGEDQAGELYVAIIAGDIYKLNISH